MTEPGRRGQNCRMFAVNYLPPHLMRFAEIAKTRFCESAIPTGFDGTIARRSGFNSNYKSIKYLAFSYGTHHSTGLPENAGDGDMVLEYLYAI